jgi:hypothetical protein
MKTYCKIELTDFQRENLKKLADYLSSGRLKGRFNMRAFNDYIKRDSDTTCGTLGDVVGHGPYAGIEKWENEDWLGYSSRCFIPLSFYDSWKLDITKEWAWCFSTDWHKVDNTPEGAAKRILILLEKGVPEDWVDQMKGKANLEYEIIS